MPAISSEFSALVLVTGANGFLAMHVVQALLEKGYRVRGTVRSESKTVHIRKTFAKYGDKLEFAIVEDITTEGAFDQAVVGVDAIAHTAATVGHADDPQELIVPAVNGTVGIMKSALKEGSTVKRLVCTSSTGAIIEMGSPPRVYTEENWNNAAVEAVNTKGREAPGILKYQASKVLAERAAWAFYAENKATSPYDFVTLCPPFVFGPFLHEHTGDATKLNLSMAYFYENLIVCNMDQAALTAGGSGWIDVRDAALAHVLALEKLDAGGERITICAGEFVWQDFLDAANARPSPFSGKLKVGKPGTGLSRPGAIPNNKYDTSKATRLLGLGQETAWRSKEDCAADTMAQFAEHGWELDANASIKKDSSLTSMMEN